MEKIILIHLLAKHNLAKKHVKNLKRMNTQNIKNENQSRCESSTFSIHDSSFIKHRKPINHFKNSDQQPEPEPQTKSYVKQPETVFQITNAKIDLPEEGIEKQKTRKLINSTIFQRKLFRKSVILKTNSTISLAQPRRQP